MVCVCVCVGSHMCVLYAHVLLLLLLLFETEPCYEALNDLKFHIYTSMTSNSQNPAASH